MSDPTPDPRALIAEVRDRYAHKSKAEHHMIVMLADALEAAHSKLDFISEVLALNDGFDHSGISAAIWKCIQWSTHDEYAPVTFWTNANDLFYWGTADCEEITPENLPMLKQSVRDVLAALGLEWKMLDGPEWQEYRKQTTSAAYRGVDLFSCRSRGMRPQKPCYKTIDPRLHSLFDACDGSSTEAKP